MRLLFVTPGYPPLPGGGEQYVASLAAELAARGVDITVVTSLARQEPDFWQGTPATPPAGPSPAAAGGILIHRCPVRPFPGRRPGLLAWRKLMVTLSLVPGFPLSWLQRMGRQVPPIRQLAVTLDRLPPVDLVHAFNLSWEAAALAAAAFARRRGLPLVVTPFAHFGVAGTRDRVARNTMMPHQQRLLTEAAAVLTLTEVEIAGLRRWGVQPRHAAVLGGGVAPPPPKPEPPPGCGVPSPYALFLGRANADKGALDAVTATLRLRQQGQPLHLALAGPLTPEFERVFTRLTPTDRAGVWPLGYVSHAEKHALLAGCSMLLLPSRSDSFGLVFLEAWAHGKPVIGADAGGIPGVVDHGRNGLLVPYGDVPALAAAMGRLLTDQALARSLGRHGQDKVERQYTWPRVADRLLEAYETVPDRTGS